MIRNVFFGSAVLCLLCIGLSLVSDPSVFGIQEEPERIMFYGGSGLLAGLSGFVAIVSGIYIAAVRSTGFSSGQRRFIYAAVLIVLIAVLIAVFIRSSPAF
ncbi:MAG: hypothetical protein OER97_05830 [Gammaproteobacteria bacterium]|nr:hypothetical protein [Gammaproteobacteria bacterium]